MRNNVRHGVCILTCFVDSDVERKSSFIHSFISAWLVPRMTRGCHYESMHKYLFIISQPPYCLCVQSLVTCSELFSISVHAEHESHFLCACIIVCWFVRAPLNSVMGPLVRCAWDCIGIVLLKSLCLNQHLGSVLFTVSKKGNVITPLYIRTSMQRKRSYQCKKAMTGITTLAVKMMLSVLWMSYVQ